MVEELQKLRYIDDVLSINNPYFAKKLDSTNLHKMPGGGGAVVFNATDV
jgi:hypothetical protein